MTNDRMQSVLSGIFMFECIIIGTGKHNVHQCFYSEHFYYCIHHEMFTQYKRRIKKNLQTEVARFGKALFSKEEELFLIP